MRKYYQFVKMYPFSITCFILIWVLSLMPFFPETGLEDVAFIDKWTHLVMYGGTCSVLWIEALLRPLPKGGVGVGISDSTFYSMDRTQMRDRH